MTRKTWPKGVKNIYIFTSTVALIFILFGVRQAFAISTSSVNLQGKIVRNDTGHEGLNVTPGNPSCVIAGAGNDTCDFRVRYYNAPSGGTLLLTEEFSNKEIGQYNGAFNLSLGTDSSPTAGTYSSLSALINGEDAVYIEIGFAPGGNNSYTEVFTRMPLQASPYAIRSKYASEASNVSWSGITNPEDNQSLTMGTHNTAWNWSTGLFSSNWDSNAGANNLFSLNTGNITGTGSLLNVQTGSSATISPLRVRAGSSEAIFVDNQGRVGLGTTSPLAKLHVLGGGIFEDLLATSPEGGLVEVGGVRYAGAVSIPAVSTTSMGAIESPWIRTGYYQNFLRYTEEFQRNTANDWVQTNIASVTANSHVAPLETATTADTIVGNSANGALTQTVAASAAGIADTGPWTFSIYLKTNSGTADVDLQINSTNASGVVVEAGTAKTVTINETWQRYSVVQDFTNASHTRKNVVLKVGTNTVIAWGAQLEPSSYARRYSAARTTSLVTTNTSTALISTALGVSGSISGTSIAASSSITSTRSGTPAAPVEGLIATAGAATAAIPVRPSPRLRLRGTAWNTTPTAATNNIDFSLETMPISGSTTSGYLRFLYGGHGAALVDHVEIARLTDTGDFSIIGNLGVGTTAPTQKLDVDGEARIRTISNATGNILTVSSTGVVQQRTPAELLGDIGAGTGTVGGSGIANYVARWTDANTLGTGVLYDDGSNVGIGTASPTSKLEVVAANGQTGLTIHGGTTDYTDLLKMIGNAATQRLILERTGGATTFLEAGGSIGLFGTVSNHDFRIRTNYTDRMSITASGNVGIGDTSPASLLTVGSGDLFQVNSSGDLIKIKNVTYSWPSGNATTDGQVLTSTTGGVLSWQSVTSGVSSVSSGDTTLTISPTTGAVKASLNLSNANTWTGSQAFTGGATIRGLTVDHATATRDKIAISVADTGSTSNTGTITNADLTGARTWTLPNVTGTIALTSDISTYSEITEAEIDSTIDYTGRLITGRRAQYLLRNNVTDSTTANFATGATSSTNTKTVNLGTGGVTGSTTNVNIGSTIAGSTTVNSPALSMRAAPTVSASTQIPVFISDPSTSSQIMYTRTPAQLRSDIGAVGGTGTEHYVARWTATAGVLGTGVLYDNGTNVGVGTTSPTVKLDVAGQGRFESTVYPVVDITRDTGGSGGGIYGGARLQRKTTAPVNGGGIGFFFWYPNSAGVLEEAGMFGGALANTTSGSEIGEIVFGAAYHGADPYSQRHLMIRAVNSSSGEVRIPYRLKIGADSSPSKELDITGDAIISGLLGVGTTAPSEKLDVNGSARIRTISNATGNILTVSTTGVVQQRTPAELLGDIGAGTVGGTGTEHYVARWTATAGVLGTGLLYDTGANVGIGTTTLGSRLVVKGSGNTSATSSLNIINSSDTSLLFVRNDGNVGIGTATPIAQLDVSGTFATKMGATVSASTQIPVFISDPSTSSQIMYTRTPAQLRSDIGAVGGTGTEHYVARWTATAGVLGTGVLYDNGTNVGVGTTTPAAKLDVAGTFGTGTTAQRITNTTAANINNIAQVGFALNRTTGGLTEVAQIRGLITDIGNTSYKGALAFLTSTNNAAPTEKMRIAANGNVGIGTTAPTEKLDVNGSARIRTISNATGNILTVSTTGVVQQRTPAELLGDIGAGTVGGTGTEHYVARWTATAGVLGTGLLYDTGANVGIGTTTLGSRLVVKGSGNTSATSSLNIINSSDTSLLFVRNDGNVGIGTTTPGQKLDVTGSIRSSSQLISTVATGTAPLAVSSTTVVTNLNADTVDGFHASSTPTANYLLPLDSALRFNAPLYIRDTRSIVTTPGSYNQEAAWDFKSNSTIGLSGAGTYSGVLGVGPWSDDSGGGSHEIAFAQDGNLYHRSGTRSAGWGSWTQLLNMENLSSNAWLLGGNTLNATGILGTKSNHSLQFVTNDTNRMIITNAGDVGIGTATPLATLSVLDNNAYTGSTNSFSIIQPNSYTAFQTEVFKVRSDSSIKISDRYNDTLPAVGLHLNYFDKSVGMYIGRDYSNLADTALAVVQNRTGTHDFSGSISSGITTGALNSNNNTRTGLSVVSRYESNNYTAATAAKTYGVYSISGTTSSVSTAGATKRWYGGYFSAQPSFGTSNANSIAIGIEASATGAQYNYAALFTGGNVGIGTATPIAQLDVSGTFATKMGATVSASTQIPVFVSDPSTNSQIMYTRTPAQLRSDIGAGAGTVEGTGIQDYVARWTNASTIGTGVLYDNGTNVGVGTTSPITKLHIAGDGGILAQGTYGTGWNGGSLGSGSRLMWIPSKAAFRAGYVGSTQWDTANIGNYSVAMGQSTTASGIVSTAMGFSTTASGYGSTAIGYGTTASNHYSTAMGINTTASGTYSTAMGGYTSASGTYSTAMGHGATASGDYSTAMGNSTTAQAYASTVLGRYNVISGTTDSWVATDPIFSIGIGSNTSNRANAMTVLKNGNVGIGTTSPSTLLQLGQVGTAGTLGIAGSTSGLVTLQTAAAAGTWTMTLPTSGGSNGQVLTTNGSGVTSWANVGTASNVALSGITAAISANSINSGDYAQVWNWQLTSANKVAFTFGENVASTATGSPAILSASTLASSTAMPLYIKNLGNANSFRVDDEVSDTTPFVIDASGNVGVGTASPNSLLRIHNGSSFQTPGTYLTDWGVSYTTSNGNLAFNNSAIRGGGYPALASIAGDGSTSSTISIPSSSMGFSSFGATNAVFATLSPGGSRSSHNIVGYQPMSSQDASNHSYNLYLYSDGGSANTDIGITPTHTNIFSNINKGSGTANYNVYSIRSVVNGNTSNNATGYGVYSSVSGFGTNYSIYSAAGTNYFAGNVGIGTATPIAQLDVSGTFATKMGATVSASTQIPVFVSDPSTNSQIMYTRTPAQLRSDIGAGTGTVEGTGIQDYVARWTNASTIGTGVLYDNGTNVGVGTTSPGAKLSVNTTSYPTMELKYNNSKVVDIYSNVSSNIFIGLGSGSNITSGTGNVGYGYQALYSNTTGGGNVASGVQALYSNTTGVQNIASGYQALYFNETGTGNVAIGSQALYSSTTTSDNVAIGNAALRANTSGNFNVAIGNQALYLNTTGIQTVAIGTAALRDNTTGLRNVAIGNNALRYNTTGSYSVAIGNTALVSNTTGASNVGIGNEALGSNTTGNYNVASGFQALHSNVAKQGSTAIGHQAMRYADNIATGTTLTYNTALGYQALRGSTTAENNTGTYNTVLGANAGLGMTSGSNNTLVGYNAGNNLTTGSSNILIGSGVTASSATISNEINIGNVIYGRTDTVRVGIGVTSPTTTLDVNGQVRIRGGSPSVGKVLTSSADGTATWETPSTGGGVSWNAITNPDGDHSLSMGNHNTSWTWNTGLFSSNWTGNAASKNFFSLTTANSTTATTGALMYLGTGTSSTVNPLRIVSAGIDALFVSKPLGDGKNSRVGLGTIEPDAMLDIRVSTSEDNTEFLSMKKGSTEFFRFEKEGRLAINEDTAANGSTLKKFYRRNDQLYWDGKTLWMDGGNSIQSGLGVLGTTTNHSLQFKTNNLDRMIITNGGNVGIGTTTPGAKLSVNTSSYPTMELKYGDTKVVDIYSNNYSNIFIGLGSGSNITTGTGNVGYGYQALYSNTTGNYNVAIGQTALRSNTTGNRNVASGFQALYYNVGGSENVANGAFALFSNTTGNSNVASGNQALYSNTSGYYNVASGDQALYSNTTGNYNVAIGQTALRSNTTGNRNVASGFQALHSNVAKQGSTAIGHQAMRYADNIATGTTLTYNTALGYQALRGSTTAANNSGTVNTALGSQSLLVNTSGHHNVASGAFALVSNTSGSYNTAIGYQAGQNITTGSYNIMIGSDIMAASATGSNQLNIGNTIYGNTSTGYVGIGTSSPNHPLSIISAAYTNQLHFGQSIDSGGYLSSAFPHQFSLGGGARYSGTNWQARATSAGQMGAYEGALYFYTNSGLTVGSTFTPTERMRIRTDGRIQLATTNSLGYSFMQYVEGTTAQTYGISYMWFKPTAASSSWPSSRLVIDTGDDIQTQRSSGLSLGIGGTIRSQIAFNQGGKSLYLDTYMVGETSNNTQFVRMRFGSDFAERFRFRGDGTGYADVNWSTFSPYLSYNYIEKTKTKSDYPLGTVVSLSSNDRWTVTKSTESNRESVYGVIVLPEGFVSIPKELKNTVWGENKEIEELDNVISVAHLGEASTMVTTKGGNINYGDSVTTSSLSSFAQKTTEANRVLGTALESTSSWNAQTCPLVSSIASINWPADDGSNPSKPCFRLPDGTYVGKIMVFVNVSWHDPAPGELLARVEQLETQYNSINQQPNPLNSVLTVVEPSNTLTVDSHLVPNTNNTYNIGSSTKRWKNIYTQGVISIGANGNSGGVKYDTETKELQFSNDGSNWLALGSTTNEVTLSAQYPGSITTSNQIETGVGDELSGFMHYYELNNIEEESVSAEIRVRYTLPSNFASWTNDAIRLSYVTEGIDDDSSVDIEVFKQDTPNTKGHSLDNVSSVAEEWTSILLSGNQLSNTCTEPGDVCIVVIRLHSKDDSYVRVGDIKFNYNRKL